MKIAVLGAGALGSWFGGKLARCNTDVTLLTTNVAHVTAINQQGLTMRDKNREDNVTVRAMHPENFSEPVDLILLLTKSFQSHQALSTITSSLGKNTAILSLQNGLGNLEIISQFVPQAQILLGNTMMPVDKIAPGIVESHGSGVTWFSHLDSQTEKLGSQLKESMVDAGLDVRIDPEIMQRIWHKVAFNAGMNAATALSNATPGTIGDSTGAMDLVIEVAAEAVTVAVSCGIQLDLNSVKETIESACREHRDHISSMRQDITDSRQTEVDAINGEISRLGRVAGISTPLNDTMGTLIRLAELSNTRYRQ